MNKEQKNKIMIVGAGVYQVPLIQRAKERGLETIVVSPDGNYPGLAIADKVYYLDVRAEDEILEAARKEGISGVITDQTDIAVRTVAYVADNMGLPGIGYECAELFTDKLLMRDKSLALGLPTIKYRKVNTLEEAEEFFKELNPHLREESAKKLNPCLRGESAGCDQTRSDADDQTGSADDQTGSAADDQTRVTTDGQTRSTDDDQTRSTDDHIRYAMIKPADNQGSRGVSKIDSLAKLRERFPEAQGFSRTGNVVIEEFIQGKEFEVDSIVFRNQAKTLMYADLEDFSIPDVFASTTRLYPSVADQSILEKLLELNRRIIEGFGLSQGLTHSEYIRDDATGEIYLIESAARGGGTYISSHIAQLQSGINTSDFLIDIATGQLEQMPDFTTGQCACGYVTFYIPEGVVTSIKGVEEVKSREWVCKHMLDDIHVGMKTDAVSDKTARYAVILKADDRAHLDERISEVRQLLDVKVETPDGVRGLIWE